MVLTENNAAHGHFILAIPQAALPILQSLMNQTDEMTPQQHNSHLAALEHCGGEALFDSLLLLSQHLEDNQVKLLGPDTPNKSRWEETVLAEAANVAADLPNLPAIMRDASHPRYQTGFWIAPAAGAREKIAPDFSAIPTPASLVALAWERRPKRPGEKAEAPYPHGGARYYGHGDLSLARKLVTEDPSGLLKGYVAPSPYSDHGVKRTTAILDARALPSCGL